jgi:hypothetical protein
LQWIHASWCSKTAGSDEQTNRPSALTRGGNLKPGQLLEPGPITAAEHSDRLPTAHADLLGSLGALQNNQDSNSLHEGHGSLAHGDEKQSRP